MVSYREIKNEEFDREIKQLFPIDDFIVGELIFGGIIPIVLVRFNDLDSLSKNWKEFNSYLASEYTISIKDEYSKWNFYIFYLSKDIVEKSMKYEIENNKFSSRKIVIENLTSISEVEINNIISEHITNDNIQVDIEKNKVTKFIKDSTLSKIIDMLPKTKKIDEVELQNALDLIEKKYKDEI